MGPEKLEKVLEKLATTDKTTIVVERQADGENLLTDQLGIFYGTREPRKSS